MVSTVVEIRVPAVADGGAKLSLGRWFKRTGDPVGANEALVEIETGGATHEVRAPVTGVLATILVEDGGSVGVGTVVGSIRQF
jgi:2-oxoglutarate dehydrogenase E2 component (dihydrolipoamide succinyltransferase)